MKSNKSKSGRDKVKKQYEIIGKIEYFEEILKCIEQYLVSKSNEEGETSESEQYIKISFLNREIAFSDKPEKYSNEFIYDKGYPFVLALEGIRTRFIERIAELEETLERIK